MPLPLPPERAERIYLILFDKKKFDLRSVRAKVKAWGYDARRVRSGVIFWRLEISPLPQKAKGVELLRLEEGVYALEVQV